jgi:hypothetical protein
MDASRHESIPSTPKVTTFSPATVGEKRQKVGGYGPETSVTRGQKRVSSIPLIWVYLDQRVLLRTESEVVRYTSDFSEDRERENFALFYIIA